MRTESTHFIAGRDTSLRDVSVSRRLQAVAEDALTLGVVDLGSVWRSLAAREAAVVDYFSTDERHYLVLEYALPHGPRLNPASLRFLELVLLGRSQKRTAIEFGVAPSTVAGGASEILSAMGVGVPASRAPLLLALLVHADQGDASIRQGRFSLFVDGPLRLHVVSTPRLGASMRRLLSPAEQQVLWLRAEGRSHAEIASHRNSSLRTVANQIASGSRKLGVSGRSELMSYLSRAEA